MVELLRLSNDIAVDLRNKELALPGLTDTILARLSQAFKAASRQVAFSPAGSHSGILAGRTGKTWAATFFYRQSNRKGAALQVFSLTSRLANIFEGSGYSAAGKYPIMSATIKAFQTMDSDRIIEEEMAKWGQE